MEGKSRKTEYITIGEIADVLGISYSTARELVICKMKYIKIGGRYRVREEEFRKYLKQQECKS